MTNQRPTAEIKVIHYGPHIVPDPDHSTYVEIKRGKSAQFFNLDTDQELDDLIQALENARQKGDIHNG